MANAQHAAFNPFKGIAANLKGKAVPPNKTNRSRFLFIFLVDVSSSTGFGGANADIHAINRDLAKCFEQLRNPPTDDPLYAVKNQIDISLVTYSNTPKPIIEWESADALPSALNLTPEFSTNTCRALHFAMDMIEARLNLIGKPGQKVSTGTPHIFHITDGVPRDVKVGTPEWEDLQARIRRFDAGANKEDTQKGHILHFLSPKSSSYDPDNPAADEHGNPISGQQMMSKLSGDETIITLTRGAESMKAMVRLITALITVKSSPGAKKQVKDVIQEEVAASGGALATPIGMPKTKF